MCFSLLSKPPSLMGTSSIHEYYGYNWIIINEDYDGLVLTMITMICYD